MCRICTLGNEQLVISPGNNKNILSLKLTTIIHILSLNRNWVDVKRNYCPQNRLHKTTLRHKGIPTDDN